jgi:glyoxylase-like metal-dependent hydrolase (beta-lactamase superfamily II)
MTFHLCETCGTQLPAVAGGAPERCAICDDERQYVPQATGQRFTTLDELRGTHRNVLVELEPGLTSIRTAPGFAIGHHALLVETPGGNVLWDSVPLIDDATVAAIRARGPVVAIAISHPHFYATMVEWSRALGGAPIYVHADDRRWIQRDDPAVQPWHGAPPPLPGGLTLVRTGGHFAGSQVLLWPGGAEGRGALLAGDEPNVCSDARWVTFMRSFPNYIPLSATEAERVVAALRPLAFDRIYGWNPERVLLAGAKQRLERSLERHVRALGGEHGVVAPAPATVVA